MRDQLLYHEVYGQGKPCLLLAGFASDALSWVFQIPALSEGHQVILCDNRGVGRSFTPESPYSLKDMAEDVVQLLDSLGIERVSLIGHSMGGAIAQHFALKYPDRIDRLILACTFMKMSPRIQRVLEAWQMCLEEKVSFELQSRLIFPWLYSEQFFRRPNGFEMAKKLMSEHPYPLKARGLAGQIEAMLQHDSLSQLAQLRCPTTVVAAERDALVDVGHCRELHGCIPSAEWVLLPEVGHACMLEDPQDFNRAVLACLAS